MERKKQGTNTRGSCQGVLGAELPLLAAWVQKGCGCESKGVWLKGASASLPSHGSVVVPLAEHSPEEGQLRGGKG